MGKVRHLFVCSNCDRAAAQWAGRCSGCGEWGTVAEQPVTVGPAGRSSSRPQLRLAGLGPEYEERRMPTGFPGLDRVLGGGLVAGSAILLAGAPGIGKSTLLLQLASCLADAGHSCLIASGEEARDQVASRAGRIGLTGDALTFVPGRDLGDVLHAARTHRPAVLVVDSVHTIRDPGSDALPGGVGQVRLCADALIGLAKEQGTTLLLIGHVTKEGDLAGPRTLEHAVDVVLTFEGDPRSGRRILAGGKNRFGPEGEVTWLEMTSRGLVETDTGPRIGDGGAEVGCATALPLVGRRAIAVEVQALAVPTEGPPRRHVSGLDPRRFHILAAVADRVSGRSLARSELYGAVAGGLRLDDPGADLAVVAALASAAAGDPLPVGVGFVGEVSLTGAVRPVPGGEARLSAARAAGLEAVVVPPGAAAIGGKASANLELVEVRHLREVVVRVLGRKVRRPTRVSPATARAG